ncbi:type II toxin-antitoxin system RelE/ParE family toxin [Glaciimonas sp. PCH181]|uniref:type II toxin-antitoxin system RelE/ParE family toxin n=1 Tax=Glaciimonas sp. PCH181 TaxID=2133943 RepID=UPI000D366ED0|nr:type II toxin-antitoxin system RelE/ParE family toxin [Glaciimonas sp. PCH181]PUA18940.1 type II toxin-antitoxin system RelE/ParE family toxin [Glaciimonas sp. PCH181]
MAEYRLTPAAEQDLEGIWAYTFQHWGVDQANRYTDMLVDVFEVLAQTPKTAPSCDHIRPGYRRQGVEHHVIYFRITNYGIAVIRILHDRMDASRYL